MKDFLEHYPPSFEDLGFEPAEAAQIKAEVQLEIDAAHSIKRQLMDEIAHWIEDN